MQLHRHSEAVAYLDQRGVRSPEVREHMGIGYAPGGCLRGWLTEYCFPLLAASRSVTTLAGYFALITEIAMPTVEHADWERQTHPSNLAIGPAG
jgi:hypothetical protein